MIRRHHPIEPTSYQNFSYQLRKTMNQAYRPEIFWLLGLSFLGSNVIYAVLRAENPIIFLLQTTELAVMMSCFVIGQQVLQNLLMNPSSPGALSNGNFLIVIQTSSSVKGNSKSERLMVYSHSKHVPRSSS
jgi:hypothetical protein